MQSDGKKERKKERKRKRERERKEENVCVQESQNFATFKSESNKANVNVSEGEEEETWGEVQGLSTKSYRKELVFWILWNKSGTGWNDCSILDKL